MHVRGLNVLRKVIPSHIVEKDVRPTCLRVVFHFFHKKSAFNNVACTHVYKTGSLKDKIFSHLIVLPSRKCFTLDINNNMNCIHFRTHIKTL